MRKKSIAGYCLVQLLCWLISSTYCSAQKKADGYEIPVVVRVNGIGKTALLSVVDGQYVYLPVGEFFNFLKINYAFSDAGDVVSGFFISPSNAYTIDANAGSITLSSKTIPLARGLLLRGEKDLLLRSDYFGSVFGLNCPFSPRSLSVELLSQVELPAIRQKRLESIRRNLLQLKGSTRADTNIRAPLPFFHFGMADWALTAVQQKQGYQDVRFNLGLGFTLAGGECFVSLNYGNKVRFEERNQYYLWRYVNNDNKAVKQLAFGKVYAPAVATIYGPITGVQISNTPTTFRRSFGTYTISNFTKPGWTVELYVNNIMVAYKVANSSGYYSFDVPLVYGTSAIKLRFYGLNGEEGHYEENISAPFNFLPKNCFEYNVTAGLVEDRQGSQFAKANVSYGMSRHITIGTGAEYLSTLGSNKLMPYANSSVLLLKNLLITADYVHGVRTKGILNYQNASMQAELNYTRYVPGQTAINNNFLEERRLILSVPVRKEGHSMNVRAAVNEIVHPRGKYRTGELVLSGLVGGVNAHMGTYCALNNVEGDEVRPLAYSILTLGFRLPGKIVFTPKLQYYYTQGRFSLLSGLLEKRISRKGYANIACEQNYITNIRDYRFGFRYDLKTAQVAFSGVANGDDYSMTESAKGSLLVDRASNLCELSNKSSQGRGGIVVTPFIDLNGNGMRDLGERKVAGLKIKVNMGKVVQSENDTSLRIYNLEPYQSYFIEPEVNSFSNVAWQMKKQIIGAAVVPYQFTKVDIPITPMGEVSGNVVLTGARSKGIGRIIVYIYDEHSKIVAYLLTEEDGYFNYASLLPGSYTAMLDGRQLESLHYTSSAMNIAFVVKPNEDGDVIGKLQFSLKP